MRYADQLIRVFLLPGFAMVLGASGVMAAELPVAVSPGSPVEVVVTRDPCPTFSWGAVDGARSYELVVYRIGEEAEPLLKEKIPGSALSWTPDASGCLEPGGKYAWSVRAVGARPRRGWSDPSLFELAAEPSRAELERALAVVERYLRTAHGESAGPAPPRRAEGRSPVLPPAGPGPSGRQVGSRLADAPVGDSSLLVNGSPVVTTATLPGRLLSVSRNNDKLRSVDPRTGATLDSIGITLAGETVLGATGLVSDWAGTLWAILKLSGQTGRELVTLDAATGVATSIGAGDLGDKFAGLAFDASGTLYGVTGDGATTPESLFTIDTTTAVATLATALGNGSDGETIAFDPLSGLLYHASGIGDETLETINPSGFGITNVPLSGAGYSEALAMVFDPSRLAFILTDLGGSLYTVTPSGFVSSVGSLDHSSKGLAIVR